MALEEQFANSLDEHALIHFVAQSKVESSLAMLRRLLQSQLVEPVLPCRFFQVLHGRKSDERLDFDGDPFAGTLGSHQLLGPDVNQKRCLIDRNRQWVMRNRPAVL